MGESQSERKPHLNKRGRIGREHGEELDFTVKEGRFQGGEGEEAKRSPQKKYFGERKGIGMGA